MSAFTFDGKGINDAADPYRRRLATLAPDAPRDAGVLMAAAPDLLAALEDMVSRCVVTYGTDAAYTANARAAIARARGEP
jgi:hypothetical protein